MHSFFNVENVWAILRSLIMYIGGVPGLLLFILFLPYVL